MMNFVYGLLWGGFVWAGFKEHCGPLFVRCDLFSLPCLYFYEFLLEIHKYYKKFDELLFPQLKY